MSVHFSAALTRIDGLWTAFKTTVLARGLTPYVQYNDDGVSYVIFAIDASLVFTCQIWQGAVPAGNYTQAQNDADKAEFEAGFKPYANRNLAQTKSQLIAMTLKSGGSSNFGVNGSVTPVVFSISPAGQDAQLQAFNIIIESATVFGFGNKFILNSLATLTNGLLLEVKSDDVATTWQNMKRTRDLVEISSGFDIAAAGSVNLLRVKINLPQALYLRRDGTFANPDYIRLTVRDDLSTIGFAEAHVQGTLF